MSTLTCRSRVCCIGHVRQKLNERWWYVWSTAPFPVWSVMTEADGRARGSETSGTVLCLTCGRAIIGSPADSSAWASWYLRRAFGTERLLTYFVSSPNQGDYRMRTVPHLTGMPCERQWGTSRETEAGKRVCMEARVRNEYDSRLPNATSLGNTRAEVHAREL